MMSNLLTPEDTLKFIKRCLRERRVFWTYHVNMRLGERTLKREEIFQSLDSLEIIECYPEDKYFPSYLLLGMLGTKAFHVQVAVDASGGNIRVITAYIPDPEKWNQSLRRRR